MKLEIVLNHDEIQTEIPYALVCETMEGARWETGTRKRKFAQEFTESERDRVYKLRKQAHTWYLVKGVPDEIRMTPRTLLLWQRLGDFCASL